MRHFLRSLFQKDRPGSTPTLADLAETSMNFDQDNVMPFLNGLQASTGVAIAPQSLQQVARALDEMRTGETRRFLLNPARDLQLEIFMDDIQAPDLYFIGPDVEIEQIDDALVAFAEKLGI